MEGTGLTIGCQRVSTVIGQDKLATRQKHRHQIIRRASRGRDLAYRKEIEVKRNCRLHRTFIQSQHGVSEETSRYEQNLNSNKTMRGIELKTSGADGYQTIALNSVAFRSLHTTSRLAM